MTIFFYKAQGPYGCFSNFSLHSIELQGYTWPTSEHYYQAQKFYGTLHHDLQDQIRQAPTPEEAAAMGRHPDYAIRADWDQVKRKVMYAAVWTKFLTHANIQQILLDTGTAMIVENSPLDTYWGCGIHGNGLNQLGKILMQVREELLALDQGSSLKLQG
ncbi:MAG: NADAR family protein [Acaryochloridaceae cyanobacterium SU_2_1]|nr:NADAR family protein [Acaryochloridaceae cyanobacterium SU_2_1]NJM95565.1 NADAR family protein [Acaryochloridaceae cyanobacterium CSU_5_19]